MPGSTRSTRSRKVKTHCQACKEPDTDRMVSCGHCGSWWHYACVGVNESIAEPERTFTCPICQKPSAQIPVGGFSSSRASSKASSTSTTASSRAKKARLQLERLEAQKALAMKRIELERREQDRRLEQQKKEAETLLQLKLDQERQRKNAELEKLQLEMEQTVMNESFRLREIIETEDNDDDGGSRVSEQSSISKVERWRIMNSTMKTMAEKNPTDPGNEQVTATTGTLARQDSSGQPTSETEDVLGKALAGISLGPVDLEPTLGGLIGRTENVTEQDVVREQHVIPPSVNVPSPQCQSSVSNIVSAIENPPNSVSAQSNNVNQISASHGRGTVTVQDLLGESYPLPLNNQVFVPRQCTLPGVQQPSSDDRRVHLQRPPIHAIQTHDGAGPSPVQHSGYVENVDFEPTARQLAARHVMAKELPTFSGNPEDWPLFISSYNNSTRACGFSDAENLARLQRCLKGHALESVRSRLLLPSSVPHVLATLETLYGRPELLIHSLLQKVRNVPAPKQDRLDTLIGFGMAVQNLSDHLEAGRQEAHLNNPMLLFELVEKLPAHMKLDWSLYKQRCAAVNLRTFSQYMQTLVRAATDVTLNYDPTQYQQRTLKDKKSFCGTHTAKEDSEAVMETESAPNASYPTGPTCYICKSPEHRVKDCDEFEQKTVDDRWRIVQQIGLCRLCLGSHGRRPCKVRKQCGINGCPSRHHPMLHSTQKFSNSKAESNEPRPGPSTEKSTETNAATNHHFTGKSTLFRIIPVTLYGNNRSVTEFAFLDDGSEKTLVDEDVVKKLGVVGEPQALCLQWTSNVKRTEPNSQRLTLEIAGNNGAGRHTLKDVRTVSKLELPRQSLCYADLSASYPYLEGLPIEDYMNVLPRILIGNDNAHVTSTLKIRDGRPGEPIAAKSRLGWTVYGSSQDRTAETKHSFHICECQDDDQSVHELVEQFFSVESLGIMHVPRVESEEEQRANRILKETTKRIGQRFQTGLLWKYDYFEFPDSYPMAVRRLQCLERKMQSDPVIGDSVKRQISEYQQKGYIHRATVEELNEADIRRTWYLPLGVVINPKKPSKIRIFCDAAAKVDGTSLNTMLLKGPDFLKTLLEVLFGFRERRVALCADLKEMFHQIQIRPEDRHAQRLLWRDDPAKQPEVYLMDVATFGATCSPCSAHYVKNLNAEEHSNEYPAAADAIIRKHYVDDYLDSSDSVEEAVQLALQVKHVHSLGGFHLRNWLSNSEEVLARIGEKESQSGKLLQLEKGKSTERVLGMYWKPEPDVFTFSTSLATSVEHPTKRQALRVVMSLFDPAGLLCFFLIHGKILIQDLWRAKTEWDQLIPQELCERWIRWTTMFQNLDQISVSRCYFSQYSVRDIVSLQLHIYVDASEEAYACVAYWRAVLPNGIQVSLIGGKSKVAPLKALSIPRLELMAAVIGVRLMKTIVSGHSLTIEKTIFWCDSKTVLAWINSDHRKYRQFVACRVGEILSKSRPEQWRWISTKKNVADEATKWGKGPCFSPNSRWFRGEDDLYLPEDQWDNDRGLVIDKTNEELRICMIHREANTVPFVNWDRFSKWTRLYRAVAYVHRYVNNLRCSATRKERTNGLLTQEELHKAEATIFRWVQWEEYPDEVVALTNGHNKQPGLQFALEKNSKIRTLSPFLDELGVMRSDSRIAAAKFATFDTRYPLILPKDHRVTDLVLQWYHQMYLHANGETIVNEVRQRFHIPQLRTKVRRVGKECKMCRIKKPVPTIPRMASLPAARLRPHVRSFSFVGIDYFGPIGVKVNRSVVKRWVALFTCMTTRAIHLEVVHSLSTQSCKLAIRRFIGRRGTPVEIRSDRGTNFVGTSNDLKKEMEQTNSELASTFTNANTKWIFNPPGAPHMGGAWERLVRSVKAALAAMDTPKTPNEETFATILVEAESIVNSRPLTYIPLQSAEQEALTPNHFLLLSSSGVVQAPNNIADPKQACRTDWEHCRIMVDQFWRRWVREYLPTIARRTKWFEDVKAIEVGDLVMMVEEKTRNGWIRGRVAEINVGKDGRVRDAVVQTANGLVHRPVSRIALLDVEDSKAGPDGPLASLTGRGTVDVTD
ncbi:uncharacterized protein LOC134289727 [Aedes albopictus]|uniref:Endonuclease n=1 Tax=Aedes albopictus TaxID=7160 RepID=A0ABM1Y8R8_AEDAL